MIEATTAAPTSRVNGGADLDRRSSIPTAQLYHVATTTRRSVSRVRRAAGQLDHLRVRATAARGCGGSRGGAGTGSMRSAAARAATSRRIPKNPNIFYAGSQGALLTRFDRRTG